MGDASMATEHTLTLLRDRITTAEYTRDLAESRLAEAKDAYLAAALEAEPAARPAAGFTAPPAPAAPPALSACPHCHAQPQPQVGMRGAGILPC